MEEEVKVTEESEQQDTKINEEQQENEEVQQEIKVDIQQPGEVEDKVNELIESGQAGTIDVVVPVDMREMTTLESDKGKINIIHEITIGDLLVSTSLVAILVFMVLSRVIRR